MQYPTSTLFVVLKSIDMNPLTVYRSIYLNSHMPEVKRSRSANHLNVVAPQMGGNMGKDRRTRGTGRRKEERNSHFHPS